MFNSRKSYTLAALLSAIAFALPAAAVEDTLLPLARESKHFIVPFLGYQYLNGEQIGVDYKVVITDPSFPGMTFSFEDSLRAERNDVSPALGLTYRFKVVPAIQFETSFALLQDKATYNYPVVMDFFGFQQRRDIQVRRSNTSLLNLDGRLEFPSGLNWLTTSLKLGVGYAWRKIETEWSFSNTAGVESDITVIDADRMYVVGAGVDFTLWNGSAFIIQGGLNYMQMIPVDSDVDPFGGIGWRISAFPMWSGR